MTINLIFLPKGSPLKLIKVKRKCVIDKFDWSLKMIKAEHQSMIFSQSAEDVVV